MPSAATCGAERRRRRRELVAGALRCRTRDRRCRRRGRTESRSARPGASSAVQLVRRQVVAQHVAPVVGEPELLRHRDRSRSRRVLRTPRATISGSRSRRAFMRVMVRVARSRRLADVARRADRHVELAVGAEGDELPAVVAVGREGVADHHGLRRMRRDRGSMSSEAQDAVHRGDVERAVAKRHAARHRAARWPGRARRRPCRHRRDPRPRTPCPRSVSPRRRRRAGPSAICAGVGDLGRVDGDAEPGGQGDVAHLRGRARHEAGHVAAEVAADHDGRHHRHQGEHRQDDRASTHGHDRGAART